MDLQPRKCQWLAMQAATAIESLRVGDHTVPRVEQITALGTAISTSDPAGAATRHRMQQAWTTWWANSALLRCWKVGFAARARLFNGVITSVALWGMERVATRQEDTDALPTLSLTLLSSTQPTRRKSGEGCVTLFRWWRADTRKTFNSFGHSL